MITSKKNEIRCSECGEMKLRLSDCSECINVIDACDPCIQDHMTEQHENDHD